MKLKHIVVALIVAAVPSFALASGGDGPDVGTTNARVHIVLVGATGEAPSSVTSNARIHIVIVGGREIRTPTPAVAAQTTRRLHGFAGPSFRP